MTEQELENIPLDERKLVKGVDDAIIAIEFEMERKMDSIKRTEQKLQLSENEKIRIGAEYALHRNIKKLITYFKRTINAHLGKIPPNAVDLEEAILGAAMLETRNVEPLYRKNEQGHFEPATFAKPSAISQVRHFLKPDHFYSEAHQLIYKAVLDTPEDDLDMRTVVNTLRSQGKIELVGGAHYIAELTAKVSSGANIEYHARVVIEFAMMRELLTMAGDIFLKAYDDSIDRIEYFDEIKTRTLTIGTWLKK
jgi:hypothetical protein